MERTPIALALVLAPLALLCAGCSGINTHYDISPATLLLPGLVQQDQLVPESFVAKESEITVAQGK
ncbi:MAG TPA: hypothetical protein VJ063_18180 [Verrucomicrobiae bacterium]|nr:hypothetical protein [Verrucomicrobiae bacterium]